MFEILQSSVIGNARLFAGTLKKKGTAGKSGLIQPELV